PSTKTYFFPNSIDTKVAVFIQKHFFGFLYTDSSDKFVESGISSFNSIGNNINWLVNTFCQYLDIYFWAFIMLIFIKSVFNLFEKKQLCFYILLNRGFSFCYFRKRKAYHFFVMLIFFQSKYSMFVEGVV